MTAFDQALFLLSARCKKIEEDLGVCVSQVVLECDKKDGAGTVRKLYSKFDGNFVDMSRHEESVAETPNPEPGPEVVLQNDQIFAPPALPDEAPVERVEVLPPIVEEIPVEALPADDESQSSQSKKKK